MSFRKLAQEAKKLNTRFKANMAVGDGTSFEFEFQLLTGREGMWVYRDNLSGESNTSFTMKVDHRSACASLISLNDGEEVLSPIDIVRILYPDTSLDSIAKTLEKNVGELDEVSMQILWTSVSDKCISVDDFLNKATLPEKEVVWELLHYGFLDTYDPEFNFAFTNVWVDAYREVKPTPESLALRKSLDELKDSMLKVQAAAEKTQLEAEQAIEIPAPIAEPPVPVEEAKNAEATTVGA